MKKKKIWKIVIPYLIFFFVLACLISLPIVGYNLIKVNKALEEIEIELVNKNLELEQAILKIQTLEEENITLGKEIAKQRERQTKIATSRSRNYSRETWNDEELLARIIFAEAGGSTEEDMLLVGNVVLNRVASNRFPNTIKEVIYAPGQYAPTWNGAIHKTPSQEAGDCAEKLLNGERFCPENVVFQAQFKQGSGVWKQVNSHYYCYQ